MSLLIAKAFKNEFLLLTDTKLTLTTGKPSTIQNGIIKCKIVGPKICIGWAGNPYYAEQALQAIQPSTPMGEVLRISQKIAQDSNGETEFIVAAKLAKPVVYEIKSSIDGPKNQAWAGHIDGFNAYQSYLQGTPPRVKGQIARIGGLNGEKVRQVSADMVTAFMGVIEDASIPEVGHFRVQVTYEGKLSYGLYFDNHSQPLPFETDFLGRKSFSMGHTTRGDYSMAMYASEFPRHVIAFYFYEGKFGLVFDEKEGGLIQYEKTIHDVTDEAFCEQVEAEFGKIHCLHVRPGYGRP